MKQSLLITLVVIALYVPTIASAVDYSPLVGIPGVPDTTDFNKYINALYALSISVAALLAVIKIVIAGVKWMMTDIVTAKGEAKKDIQGALIGLFVVLAAVLILTIINPNLVKIDLTLTQPGTLAASSTPAVPVLDKSKILTLKVPGTDTEVLYSIATDNVQKQLFINSCKGMPYYGLDQARCVMAGVNESATIQTSCTQLDCSIPCKDSVFKGHIVDPINKSIGYCVSKN
jgi:hypothetical protein